MLYEYYIILGIPYNIVILLRIQYNYYLFLFPIQSNLICSSRQRIVRFSYIYEFTIPICIVPTYTLCPT